VDEKFVKGKQMSWKDKIKWEKATSYTKHGCGIYGCLLIARCTEAFKAHPRHGEFGSCLLHRSRNAAKATLNELKIKYEVKLGIPDLVVVVSQSDWANFQESENDS
jgi:hypothetical protein